MAVLLGDSPRTACSSRPPTGRCWCRRRARRPGSGSTPGDRNRVALESEARGAHRPRGRRDPLRHRRSPRRRRPARRGRRLRPRLDAAAALAAGRGPIVSVGESPAAPPRERRAARLLGKERAGAQVCFVNHCGGVGPVADFVRASRALGSTVAIGRVPAARLRRRQRRGARELPQPGAGARMSSSGSSAPPIRARPGSRLRSRSGSGCWTPDCSRPEPCPARPRRARSSPTPSARRGGGGAVPVMGVGRVGRARRGPGGVGPVTAVVHGGLTVRALRASWLVSGRGAGDGRGAGRVDRAWRGARGGRRRDGGRGRGHGPRRRARQPRRERLRGHARARQRPSSPAAERLPDVARDPRRAMREWLPAMAAAYARGGPRLRAVRPGAAVGAAEGLLWAVTTVADHHLNWPQDAGVSETVALAAATAAGPSARSAAGWSSSAAALATRPRGRPPRPRRSTPRLVRDGAAGRDGRRAPAAGGRPGRCALRRPGDLRGAGRRGRSPRPAPPDAGQRAGRHGDCAGALRAQAAGAARGLGLAGARCDDRPSLRRRGEPRSSSSRRPASPPRTRRAATCRWAGGSRRSPSCSRPV